MNYSVGNQTMNINQYATNIPACASEIDKILKFCQDFHATVINSMHSKFIIVIISLAVMITYSLFIKYSKPKFSQSDFYRKYIDYRIDFIIAIITAIMIAYLFF